MKVTRHVARRVRDRVVDKVRSDHDDPTAIYARVLDGDHLWLAVINVPDGTSFALATVDGARVPLAPEVLERLTAPSGASLRASLLELPLAGIGTAFRARVVAVLPGGNIAPVRTGPLPSTAPTRTPPSSCGWWQHEVERADDGVLVLSSTQHAPWAELVAAMSNDYALTATVKVPAEVGAVTAAELALRDGSVIATIKRGPRLELVGATADGDRQVVVVRLEKDDVAVAPGVPARLWLRTAAVVTPTVVRRARHGLSTPDFATVLPGLHDQDLTKPVLRWRFLPDGALGAVRPVPPGPDDGSHRGVS